MNKTMMKVQSALFFIGCLLAGPVTANVAATAPAVSKDAAPVVVVADETAQEVSKSTADHSKFKELKKKFKSGPEVTKACLQCHTEAAKQVHATKHWTWEYLNPVTKQKLGKKNVINNFSSRNV